MGIAMDFSNTPANPGMLRGVEADVALCRECGERMNYTPEIKILNKEEKKKENIKLVFGSINFIVFVVLLIYIIWG